MGAQVPVRGLPTEDDVKKLCRVYGATAGQQRQLVKMTRDLRAGSTPARVTLQRGGWWMQQRIGKLEEAAAQVRTFTPTVIIGLIQTRAYISSLFGDSLPPEDLERTVSAASTASMSSRPGASSPSSWPRGRFAGKWAARTSWQSSLTTLSRCHALRT